uniref:FecR family protein n=1 Tax=Prevotella sp. GTC17260 TaxID=3236796 RepID=A0AB33JBU6_9BACT
MDYQDIQAVIRQYCKNKFSVLTQKKFAWWLLNNQNHSAQEDTMELLWNETKEETSAETIEDLQRIKAVMHHRTPTTRYVRLGIAATLLIFFSSMTTILLLKRFEHVEKEDVRLVQITVPNGTTRQVILSDSTVATINGGSTLIYPSQFNSATRTVFLTGEANFSIHKDTLQPFIVQTEQLSVKALGTIFNVLANPDSRWVSTTLKEGKTEVALQQQSSGQPTNPKYLMTPDHKLIYNKISKEVTIVTVDARQVLSWTQGTLTFDAIDFQEVVSRLQHRYNVHIVCHNVRDIKGLYHVKFRPDESLHCILKVLSNICTPFDYVQKGDSIYITPRP